MDATTWFEDSCAKNELSALSSANTIYCNVTLFGIGADDIKEKGVLVNGTEDYKNNDSSHKFSSEIAATNGNGEYTVQAYAILNDGTELKTDEKIVYIVDEKVLPAITSHTIRSSYNNNGIVDKTNDFNGNLIKANVSLNDCWASNNLVESVTLVYDGLTEAMTVGTELEKSVDSRAYKNTHIDVKFSNGHHIYTPKYEINVTGIPYKITTSADKYTNNGWSKSGTINGVGIYNNASLTSPKFYLPELQNITVKMNITPSWGTTGTITVNCSSSTNFGFSKDSNKDYSAVVTAQSGYQQISLNFTGIGRARFLNINQTEILY